MGGHKYSDPDVLSLIRATGQLIDPRCAVINQARALNSEYRSYDGADVDPLQRLKIIASLCGLTVVPMKMEGSLGAARDAVLILSGNSRGEKGQILYNPHRPLGRVAFSIAHEVGHTFFPSTTSGARFRDLCGSGSREANELERLCDLAASELLMPLEEFREEIGGGYSLTGVQKLAEKFGSSFEATVFRLATAHPGIAVAGLLKYRYRKSEERASANSRQNYLFQDMTKMALDVPEPRYRRQSFFSSSACGEKYTIRWNKSFPPDSCVYLAAKSNAISRAIETLPNQSAEEGLLEAIQAPFQREDAHAEFPDLLFVWSSLPLQAKLDRGPGEEPKSGGPSFAS